MVDTKALVSKVTESWNPRIQANNKRWDNAKNRKVRWEQKIMVELNARLPKEKAEAVIRSYLAGQPEGKAIFERVSVKVKAQERLKYARL